MERGVLAERIEQAHGLVRVEPRKHVGQLGVAERVGHHLDEPGRDQGFADRLLLTKRVRLGDEADGAGGRRRGDPVVAPHADDLLDEIVLHGEVAPEARHLHLEVVAPLGERQSQRRQDPHRLRPRRRHAEHALHAGHAQRHAGTRAGRRVHVDEAAGDGPSGQLRDELGGPRARVDEPLDVGPALEAIGGVGEQAQRARRAPDGRGGEIGTLQQHAGGAPAHLGDGAAHDPGQADGLRGIGDHEHGVGERPLLAIQRGEALPGPRAPDHDAPLRHGVVVEGVQGMAALPQHVVRHVDHVADGTQAHGAQARHHPGRRGRHADAGDHAGREARTEIRGVDPGAGQNTHRLIGFLQDHRRHAQRAAREGGQLAGDPDHGQAVGAVGRHLDLEDGVVETEVRDEISSGGGLSVDDENARLVLVAHSQLALRAQHALGLHAANFRRADVPSAGQHRPGWGKGRAQARGHVGGAAHHRVPVAAGGDAAQDQAVALALAQLALDGLDLAHHHPRQPGGSERGDAGHLDAGVDETVGRLRRPQIEVHELADPPVGDFHANCSRKRRSFSKKRRMSSTPYLSMATRSMPMPKAHPVTSSGSYPTLRKT